MTDELDAIPKVFREFDITDPNGPRCDFYMKEGPLASSYDQYFTRMISVQLTLLGYVVEDFPEINHDR